MILGRADKAAPLARPGDAPNTKEEHVAVKLRLMRMGKKKQPTYRVVAADSRSPRDGRFIEIVGVYDPRREPSAIRIDNEKAVGWLRQGAQPTDSVRKLLEISGAWEEFSGQPSTRPAPSPAADTTKGKAKGESAKPDTAAKAEPGPKAEDEAETDAAAEPAAEAETDAEAEPAAAADAAAEPAADAEDSE
jgi:small subunit ribosomal protein S16